MSENLLFNLQGKKALVTGVANNMSIAFAIADLLKKHGAEIGLTYPNEILKKRVEPLAEEMNASFTVECDVADQSSIANLFNNIEQKWGQLDILVHAIGFSDKNELNGKYINTSLENFQNTMNISCYSLTSLAKHAEKLMKDGGSILTLTYYGAVKVVPNYNVMGLAKAALETSVKYLAYDLGDKNIRVNAISAGPIRTLAASGIGDFKSMLKAHATTAPLKRNTTQDDVARSAVYLLSDYACGVTGEIHYVDCGYNIMGTSIVAE